MKTTNDAKVNNELIKSPLNYIGGKYKILNQILSHFPEDINNFVDLFAGGCNVGVNVRANKIYCNDNLIYLIKMYDKFLEADLEKILKHIGKRETEFSLSKENVDGYNQIRELYNQDKNPLDLFVLVAYSFNHQIRFNNNHKFNNPFGKNRSSFNARMKDNLERFVHRIKDVQIDFSHKHFRDFDTSFLCSEDFVYCDPPYLITTGTYNDGKRGFDGWTEKEEFELLALLDDLDSRGVKFGLSNVLEHKGKTNNLLKDWVDGNENYTARTIKSDYTNSNYQTKNNRLGNGSIEVLITNY